MNTISDPDLQAGEYALGVLEAKERAETEQRALQDANFAAAIRVWERRLGPLHELIAPLEPPEGIWPQVAARLDSVPQPARSLHREFNKAAAELSDGLALRRLGREIRRWRAIATVATVLAVSLAALVVAEMLRR
jgi:anti-sigma-K factor RskA